jgi:hypothetical protein
MLISAPRILVKKKNIVKSFWNLYNQPLKNVKGVIFHKNLFSF